MIYQHPLVTILVCAFVTTAQGNGWWMEQPYPNASVFNMDVEYEQNVTLHCSDSRINNVTYSFQEWIRPDLTVMKNGDFEYFRTLYSTAGWKVEGDIMEIIYAQEQHFGFYYCRLLATDGTDAYIKKGINYGGPYFGDLWQMYRMNVIIGSSAAGGFLLACLIIYVVHHFCVDDHHSTLEDKIDGYDNNDYPIVSVGGTANGGFSGEILEKKGFEALDTPL